MNSDDKFWLKLWGGAGFLFLILMILVFAYNYVETQKDVKMAQAGMEQKFYPADYHNLSRVIWVKAHKRRPKQ